jgi:hypothetical protein
MTASVSGFSIIQGFTSTLDTMLPSAWTSPQPQLVGLWSQRMSVWEYSYAENIILTLFSAIVIAVTLIVRGYFFTPIGPFNQRRSVSPCLQSGSTRKTYFFFSSKTPKLPTSEVSI